MEKLMTTKTSNAKHFRVSRESIEYLRTESLNEDKKRDSEKFAANINELLELVENDVNDRKAFAEKHLQENFEYLLEDDFKHYCKEVKKIVTKDKTIGQQFAVSEEFNNKIKECYIRCGFDNSNVGYKDFLEYAIYLRKKKYKQ